MRPGYGSYSLEELEKAGLTERQIEIYGLAAVEGRSVTETARMLGVSKANVSKRLKRAVAKLEKYESIRRDALSELKEEVEKLKKELESIRDTVNTLLIRVWMDSVASSRRKL